MRIGPRSAVFPLPRDGERLASMARHGTMRLLCSRPLPPNEQSPHEQDELYVVARGSGVLFHDGKRDPFAAGDAMFIAAGVDHRFEDFTEDLAVWVIFYGPMGGEEGANARK